MDRRFWLTAVFIAVLATVAVVAAAEPAAAAVPGRVIAAASSLKAVINNIRNWLVGLLVVLATLLATIGGVRYLLAGGDPAEVQKAKDTLKFSAVGYGVAALAPLLVKILEGFVGK